MERFENEVNLYSNKAYSKGYRDGFTSGLKFAMNKMYNSLHLEYNKCLSDFYNESGGETDETNDRETV